MTSLELPPITATGGPARLQHPAVGATDGRIPLAVGIAIFLSSIGSLIEFDYMWYIQMALVPMTIFGCALLGIGTKPVREIRIEIWIVPILAWVIMSVGWTTGDPVEAVRQVLLNLALVVSVHVAASIFDARGVLAFLAKASVVMALLVLCDAVFRPADAFSLGRSDVGLSDLGLRSFFYQKNSLGAALVLGFAVRAALKPAWLRSGYTALVVVLLILCQSSTSIIAASAIAVMQWLSGRIVAERRSGGSGSTFMLGALAIGLVAVVVSAREQIFGLFGKDATLTGRTVIWRYSWRAIQEHRWVGYGPGGFWETTTASLSDLRHASGWTVIGSHQGLLDQWLEYGAIGVILVAVAYVACIVRVVSRVLAGDNSPVVPAALGMWTATVTASLTEGVLIRPGLVTIGLVSALLLNTPMSLPTRGVTGFAFQTDRPALSAGSPSTSSTSSWSTSPSSTSSTSSTPSRHLGQPAGPGGLSGPESPFRPSRPTTDHLPPPSAVEPDRF